MTKSKTFTENFYIALPKVHNEDLIIVKNGIFEKCCVKCGEALSQTVEERLPQEAHNSGSMACIYKFRIDTSFIADDRVDHFDTVLFGHENLKKNYNNTIWKFCPKKVVSRERYETADGYGREYIDVAKLVNFWMTDDEKAILEMEHETDKESHDFLYSNKERQNAVICVLQKIFENNFSEIVMQYIGNKISPDEKSPVKLYAHQAHVLAEIYDMINKGKRNFITQLPPRFGKTLTWLTLFKESNLHRMMIVSSYVGTVSASYIKEVSKYNDFKNMIFVNLDNFKDFEYNGEKIIIKFNTTGTTKTIAKRIDNLKKIIKKAKIKSNEIFILNEEADYGQHTQNSDEKFKMLMQNVDKRNESLVISTTGTEAFKAEKITAFGKFDGYLSVNKNDWSQIIKG